MAWSFEDEYVKDIQSLIDFLLLRNIDQTIKHKLKDIPRIFESNITDQTQTNDITKLFTFLKINTPNVNHLIYIYKIINSRQLNPSLSELIPTPLPQGVVPSQGPPEDVGLSQGPQGPQGVVPSQGPQGPDSSSGEHSNEEDEEDEDEDDDEEDEEDEEDDDDDEDEEHDEDDDEDEERQVPPIQLDDIQLDDIQLDDIQHVKSVKKITDILPSTIEPINYMNEVPLEIEPLKPLEPIKSVKKTSELLPFNI